MVVDGTGALALEVEEAVVRKIHHSRLVGSSAVGNLKFVVGGEGVGHGHLEVARIAFGTVGREYRELNHVGTH